MGSWAQHSLFEGAQSASERGHSVAVARRWERSVFLCYTPYVFGMLLSLAPIVAFPRAFLPQGLFSCCWYLPAKFNFLSEIECMRKPGITSPICCSVEVLLSTSPHLYSTQQKGCCLTPHPQCCPQRWRGFVTRRGRITTRCQCNSPRAADRVATLPHSQADSILFSLSLQASFVLLINMVRVFMWKSIGSRITRHAGTFILKSWCWF